MAKAALGLTAQGVAEKAGLTAATVRKFEKGGNVYQDTATALETFYKSAGIRFPSANVVDANALPDEPQPKRKAG